MAPQPLGDRLIRPGQALLTIDDHQGHGGFRQGQVGLLANFGQEFTVVVEHQTARIHHLEGAVAPVPLLVGAVPGDPRLVVNNGFPASAKPVHQGGFAHVGPANDGHYWKRQNGLSLSTGLDLTLQSDGARLQIPSSSHG